MRKYVKKADRIPPGPLPVRHGGYSHVNKGELIRRYPGIRHYLKRTRITLIRDLSPEGEEHLTTAKRIIVDRLMSKLSTCRLVEVWLAEHPEEILKAEKVTSLWLAMNTQIRKDLQALGLERRAIEAEVVLSPLELAAAVDVEEAGDCPSREANAPHTATHGEVRGDAEGEGEGE